jgi:hypothetical protein
MIEFYTMTRAGRFFRKLLERILGIFNEGPTPPRRISEEVRLYRALHPDATDEDWVQFATAIAENSYREAYIRGYEYAERFWPGPTDDPDALLALQNEQVSLADQHPRLRMLIELGYDPADPFGGMSATDRRAAIEQISGFARRGILKTR